MYKRLGKQTVKLQNPPAILSYAAVAGKKEGEGPLKACFDYISDDSYFGEKTWEKAESHMINASPLPATRGKLPPRRWIIFLPGIF